MSRKYRPISCSKSDFDALQTLAGDPSDQRLSLRCKMVLQCLDGCQIKDIAAQFHERPNTVILWKNRFDSEGIAGLYNRPRGKPASVYDKENLKNRISSLLQAPPPDGAPRWTGKLLADKLGLPPHVIWRYLKKHNITLSDTPSIPEASPSCVSLEIPVTLTFESKEELMKNNNADNRMNLEIIARITDDDGSVIEKTVRLDRAVPNINDFDLGTKEGFLRDFDALERSIINARNEMGEGIASAFLEEASKKNISGRNRTGTHPLKRK